MTLAPAVLVSTDADMILAELPQLWAVSPRWSPGSMLCMQTMVDEILEEKENPNVRWWALIANGEEERVEKLTFRGLGNLADAAMGACSHPDDRIQQLVSEIAHEDYKSFRVYISPIADVQKRRRSLHAMCGGNVSLTF